MKYLLDTDVCIYLIKRKHPLLTERVERQPAELFGLSTVSLAELWQGARGSDRPERSAALLDMFLVAIHPIAFDERAAVQAGEVLADLKRAGSPIGPKDALIAGHARALGATLITHNVREFRRVEGLAIEDWTKP